MSISTAISDLERGHRERERGDRSAAAAAAAATTTTTTHLTSHLSSLSLKLCPRRNRTQPYKGVNQFPSFILHEPKDDDGCNSVLTRRRRLQLGFLTRFSGHPPLSAGAGASLYLELRSGGGSFLD
ncbi:hypothetical protein L1987_22579 [Smallanthus sonchifolius]|uniref:Uncharacterized protein n=1 Tax=Smallanthus sonchifolius TaxID=185202 RepID=A0ACB9IGQ3_9ASTR|nr:hypothetical protein L1987_22579 [Smallanthus sonchifolius]